MDVPFALRGYVSDSASKYQRRDGFHFSSLNLERKSVTRFSNTSSFLGGSSQPSIAPHGTRAFHVSQVLSESSKVSNRPLSPHLALKKPQLTATYSISHRIFGAALAGGIMLVPVAMKFSLLYDV